LLHCFLTNLPQPRANPPLKPNSKLQLMCIYYVAYKGDQKNFKRHIQSYMRGQYPSHNVRHHYNPP
jgi:hypothetical protein